MKALIDAEKQQSVSHIALIRQELSSNNQLQPALLSTLAAPTPIVHSSSSELDPAVPKLDSKTTLSATAQLPDSPPSMISSPTLDSLDASSFSLSSPYFYSEKVYIYHALLTTYRHLAKFIGERPMILLGLQYSAAVIQGLTIYLVSVVLSIVQFIMIAVTFENLDWIQSYKPLMCEWDKHFPGFVFPALYIDFDDEVKDDPYIKTPPHIPKDRQYWQTRTHLKSDDDSVDDGYYSEESQQQSTTGRSMNSSLRKRFCNYQNWIHMLWSSDDKRTQSTSGDTDEEQQSDNSAHDYSAKIRHALVRTLSSGDYRPTKGRRRVTFNEQVMIFGRRRSSQVSQEFSLDAEIDHTTDPIVVPNSIHSSIAATSQANMEEKVGPNTEISDGQKGLSLAGPTSVSISPILSINCENLATLKHEEAEYQQRAASEDTNGSGSSSPTFAPSISSEPLLIASSDPSSVMPVVDKIVGDSSDLSRSNSVPTKTGSFLSRRQNSNQEPSVTSPRHASTFSESSTVAKNPRVLPDHLATSVITNAAAEPQQDIMKEAASLTTSRSSFSLGTRAIRSFSLALPRSSNNSTQTPTTVVESKSDASIMDQQGSKMNNNFMYRIVHPQRYRRNLSEKLINDERQRLLALARLQREYILNTDSLDANTDSLFLKKTKEACGGNSVVCGDPYYYATSAEYIEGLGGANSVTSTSFGTSFPEELMHRGHKPSSGLIGRSMVSRPASYDFNRESVELQANASNGYGSENETSSSRRTNILNRSILTGPHHGFFRRVTRKRSENFTLTSNDRPQSPNRLQQLLSHAGQKKSQSPTLSSEAVISVSPRESVVQNQMPTRGGRLSPPIFSSPTAATAHKLLSRARSNTRNHTKPLDPSMPVHSPAQSMTQPQFSSISLSSNEMQHTSFAAFGFPTPASSLAHSAPVSPRHSTSSMLGMENVTGYDKIHPPEKYYSLQQLQQQSMKEQYHQQQQEVLLPENEPQENEAIYYLPSSVPTPLAIGKNEQEGNRRNSFSSENSRSSSRSSNYSQSDIGANNATSPLDMAASIDGPVNGGNTASRSKGLNFLRKIHLKKKK
ncbi:hypothetical protein FBU30_006690 [Linnemannia zychae]|nr:hypothetical protein FBU30_006690 [Linnemannia zychae]